MQRSEKFFIFTWKELTVIALLAAISMGFFFTLGLHYGKKLPGNAVVATESHDAAGKLEESPEVLPPREALEQGAQHSGGATEESIKDATQTELHQSDVKLESPKQVDLPTHKKEESKHEVADAGAPETAPAEAVEAKGSDKGRFALQLGSYPSKKEAQLKIKTLQKRGIHTEIRTAVVSGVQRFRVVIPGFAKKAQADQKGHELHQKHKIDTFIVIKSE